MSSAIATTVATLLHSPCLPEIAAALQARVQAEAALRQRFYQELRADQKAEFIEGQVVLHSPARRKHLLVRKHLEKLLDTFVTSRKLGEVHGEKCLCVFPRNDYEPDVVFFGLQRMADWTGETLLFPVPDFVAEVLSESTAERDRGVKFADYEAHGVAEYWLIDPEAECVEQYLRQDERFCLALKSGSGEITSPTVAGFSISIRALFDPAENLAALRRLVAP